MLHKGHSTGQKCDHTFGSVKTTTKVLQICRLNLPISSFPSHLVSLLFLIMDIQTFNLSATLSALHTETKLAMVSFPCHTSSYRPLARYWAPRHASSFILFSQYDLSMSQSLLQAKLLHYLCYLANASSGQKANSIILDCSMLETNSSMEL